MPTIPPFILKKLYVKHSLRAEGDGFALDLKNSIAPGIILAFRGLELDGASLELERIKVVQPDGTSLPAANVSPQEPLLFPLGATFSLRIKGTALEAGTHNLKVSVEVQDVGPLDIPVADQVG